MPFQYHECIDYFRRELVSVCIEYLVSELSFVAFQSVASRRFLGDLLTFKVEARTPLGRKYFYYRRAVENIIVCPAAEIY